LREEERDLIALAQRLAAMSSNLGRVVAFFPVGGDSGFGEEEVAANAAVTVLPTIDAESVG
jgi:hypothetical protein